MILKPPKELHGYEGNHLKDYVQEDIKDNFYGDYPDMVLEAATGFGKTIATLKIIKEQDKVLNSLPNLVIVPTIPLKEQWTALLPALELRNKISVIVINGFVFNETTPKQYGIVIVDEAQRVLNEHSEWFSTALDKFKSKYRLLLSATLSNEHKQFLEKKIPNITYYKIPLVWCVKHGLVPDHVNLNIPVHLTLAEKSKVINAQTTYDKYSRHFAKYGIRSPYAKLDEEEQFWAWDYVEDTDMIIPESKRWALEDHTEGQMYGMLTKWRKATSDRNHTLQNASQKQLLVQEILEKITAHKKQKVLIFGKSIKEIEKIAAENVNVTYYHSECSIAEKKTNFKNFFTMITPYMATINTIIEGFDLANFAKGLGLLVNTTCQIAIRLAYDSKEGKTIQTIGRVLRYNEENPDQQVIMINIYVEDFSVRGKEYLSQEKKWLKNNLRGQVAIKWIDSVDDIVL